MTPATPEKQRRRRWAAWEERVLHRDYPKRPAWEVAEAINHAGASKPGFTPRSAGAVQDHAARLGITPTGQRSSNYLALHCPTCGATRSLAKALDAEPAEGVLQEYAIGNGAPTPTGKPLSVAQAWEQHPKAMERLVERLRSAVTRIQG